MVFCTNCGADLSESASDVTQSPAVPLAPYAPYGVRENIGQKIQQLANIVFGLSIFCGVLLLLAALITAFILAEEVLFTDTFLTLIVGFFLGLIAAGLSVTFGYILKIVMHGYGIIVAAHEQ